MKLHIIKSRTPNRKSIPRISSVKLWSLLEPNFIELDSGEKVQYSHRCTLVKAAGNTCTKLTICKLQRFLAYGVNPENLQAARRVSKGAITPDDVYADELFAMMLKYKKKVFRKEEKEFVEKKYKEAGLEESLVHIKHIRTI